MNLGTVNGSSKTKPNPEKNCSHLSVLMTMHNLGTQVCSLVYLVDFSIDSSQCSTQPHGWFATVGSTTTSLHCFAICTGCESLTELSLRSALGGGQRRSETTSFVII